MTGPRRLRIAGGARKGLRIQAPAGVRPTSARLREALFDLWADRLVDCRFLELFAGSGAVGIEAVSRGAARAVLVEGDRAVFTLLERNLRAAGLAGVTAVLARLPEQLARRLPAAARFDLVFADPPYRFAEFRPLLAAVEPYLAPGGEIGLEHSWRDGRPAPAEGLEAFRSRRYGDSGLTLYRRLDPPRATPVSEGRD